MDPVTLGYYGLICGVLALAAPYLTRALARFLVGVAVGLVAAGALPHLHRALAGG